MSASSSPMSSPWVCPPSLSAGLSPAGAGLFGSTLLVLEGIRSARPAGVGRGGGVSRPAVLGQGCGDVSRPAVLGGGCGGVSRLAPVPYRGLMCSSASADMHCPSACPSCLK